MRFDIIS